MSRYRLKHRRGRRGGSGNHGIHGPITPGTINGWQYVSCRGMVPAYEGIDNHARSIPTRRVLMATGCV